MTVVYKIIDHNRKQKQKKTKCSLKKNQSDAKKCETQLLLRTKKDQAARGAQWVRQHLWRERDRNVSVQDPSSDFFYYTLKCPEDMPSIKSFSPDSILLRTVYVFYLKWC